MFNLKILYAEDDAASRDGYTIVLKHYFKEVLEAKNGQEALDLYKQHKPDIVLTDIVMPQLDGLDLITQIRKDDKQTAIIVLSAYSEKTKLMKAIPLGLSDYLIKPVDGSEFTDKLLSIAKSLTPKHLLSLPNNYIFDIESRELILNKTKMPLTTNEYKFILLLSEAMPQPVSNEVINNTLWNEHSEGNNKIQSIVSRLRKKAPELISLVYDFGYKL